MFFFEIFLRCDYKLEMMLHGGFQGMVVVYKQYIEWKHLIHVFMTFLRLLFGKFSFLEKK
jgi:hypothetical protein